MWFFTPQPWCCRWFCSSRSVQATLRLYRLLIFPVLLTSRVLRTMIGMRAVRYFYGQALAWFFRISSNFQSSFWMVSFFNPIFCIFQSVRDSWESFLFWQDFYMRDSHRRSVAEMEGRLEALLLVAFEMGLFWYSAWPSLRQSKPFSVTHILLPCILLQILQGAMSKKLDDIEVEGQDSPRFGTNDKKETAQKYGSPPSKAGLHGQPQQAFIKESEKSVSAGSRPITREELAQHKKKQSAWISLRGIVYDVTAYMKHHPGGDELLDGCGRESQDLFDEHHPWINARHILKNCVVGYLSS